MTWVDWAWLVEVTLCTVLRCSLLASLASVVNIRRARGRRLSYTRDLDVGVPCWLQDRKVIVLCNLKPRNMRGIKSNGMVSSGPVRAGSINSSSKSVYGIAFRRLQIHAPAAGRFVSWPLVSALKPSDR